MKYSTESLISLIRREKSKDENDANWTLLDPIKHELSRNNIIIFGGNNTNSSKEANGYAKGIEILLDNNKRNKFDILSFYYKGEPISRSGGEIAKDYIDEIDKIYDKMFRPLLADQYGNFKTIDGLENTFRKLIFVAHCGGSNFVNHIIKNFYYDLLQNFSEKETLMIIGKLRLISYAPNELPLCNVNSFSIMPTYDNEQSWAKAVYKAQETKVNLDYPKGFVASCKKDSNQEPLGVPLSKALKDHYACMIKMGREIYYIPKQLNPNTTIGDHSIECIYKPHFLNSQSECSITANVASQATKLVLNKYAAGEKLDRKQIFRDIVEMLENPPSFKK